jgi:hypothetical protein
LAKDAYPKHTLHEPFLVDLFAKGLATKEMRRYVHLSKPRTLSQAIEEATAYEAFEEQGDAEKQRKPKNELTALVSGPTGHRSESAEHREGPSVNAVAEVPTGEGALLELVRDMSRRLEGLEERRKRKPKGELECYYCKEKGHFKRECPKLQAKEERERESRGPEEGLN